MVSGELPKETEERINRYTKRSKKNNTFLIRHALAEIEALFSHASTHNTSKTK